MITIPEHPIHIILADDDIDEHFFFTKAINALPFQHKLTIFQAGEKLITFLLDNTDMLPDVLFLDNNMPRKNGLECLSTIKSNALLKSLPVVIYSTYLHEYVANKLYEKGAWYYIHKSALPDLKKNLYHVFSLIAKKEFMRPERDQFILTC